MERKINVQFTDELSCDKLYTLAAEYAVSVDLLINIAVKRLVDDVELFRNLRAGKVKFE